MLRRVILTILIAISIIGAAAIIIMYGKGYKINFQEKKFSSSGILAISAYPDKSSIFINGKLKGVTDTSVSLSPDWYDVEIRKSGYESWKTKARVQGEVVSQIDALLVPSTPSLKALTLTGVTSPIISDSKTKVAYIVSTESTPASELKSEKGIRLLDYRMTPLGGRIEERVLFTSNLYDWTNAALEFSEDEKLVFGLFYLNITKDKKPYLVLQVKTDENNSIPTVVTSTYDEIVQTAKTDKQILQKTRLATLPKKLEEFLTANTSNIQFSPDENKIMYLATQSAKLETIINPPLPGSNPTAETRQVKPNNYYIYDFKEDKNYLLVAKKDLVKDNVIAWYTDSKHILTSEDSTIFIYDYDGTNKRSVYQGPFEKDFIFPAPPGTRVIILTNFNNPKSLPNFYEVDLR